MEPVYDLVVVGGGLVGSACARHASAGEGLKVALIGPGEPLDRADTEIFGCWHDEGRLYYSRKNWATWSYFARETVARFKEIEELSGVKFSEDCGYLGVAGPKFHGYNDWCKSTKEMVKGFGSKMLQPEDVPVLFPFMQIPSASLACYEGPGQGAGYLSPRKLVQAQQKIAQDQGCVIVASLATDLVRMENCWRIQLETGDHIYAEKIALCQGTYTGLTFLARDLLPPLDLTFTAQTTALIEVDTEEADRLKTMPTMVTQLEPVKYTYILPPIKYPNSKIYLKFGAHDLDRTLTTHDQVTNHYRMGPDQAHVNKLAQEASRLIPGLAIKSVVGDSCVTSNTPGKVAPFLGTALPGLVVAAGGCGHGAMGSDEIGRVAAVLAIEGRWDCGLPQELCRIQYKNMARL